MPVDIVKSLATERLGDAVIVMVDTDRTVNEETDTVVSIVHGLLDVALNNALSFPSGAVSSDQFASVAQLLSPPPPSQVRISAVPYPMNQFVLLPSSVLVPSDASIWVPVAFELLTVQFFTVCDEPE